jgi:threonyl-tRNA synthetase
MQRNSQVQVRHLIEEFWKTTHLQCGYELLYTPHIAKVGRIMQIGKAPMHF